MLLAKQEGEGISYFVWIIFFVAASVAVSSL